MQCGRTHELNRWLRWAFARDRLPHMECLEPSADRQVNDCVLFSPSARPRKGRRSPPATGNNRDETGGDALTSARASGRCNRAMMVTVTTPPIRKRAPPTGSGFAHKRPRFTPEITRRPWAAPLLSSDALILQRSLAVLPEPATTAKHTHPARRGQPNDSTVDTASRERSLIRLVEWKLRRRASCTNALTDTSLRSCLAEHRRGGDGGANPAPITSHTHGRPFDVAPAVC